MMPLDAAVFVIGAFGFCICFKFRASDFEFSGTTQIHKMRVFHQDLSMSLPAVYSTSAISLAAATTSSMPPLM